MVIYIIVDRGSESSKTQSSILNEKKNSGVFEMIEGIRNKY